jgi:nicotinate-nucleotide adenylyltransferase
MRKIAVFGSAFNPPSLGHKSVIESLTHFDLVLLVPSVAHAWGKSMLEYTTRCQLVEAFIEDIMLDNVESCDIESHIVEPGKSVTTYQLLEALQTHYPDDTLTFVIGPDNLLNFGKFYHSEVILDKYSIMSCPEIIKVRSTDIRNRLANGECVEDLTTLKVAHLLDELSLYRTPSSSPSKNSK